MNEMADETTVTALASPPAMIRVAVVDDHAVVRRGPRQVLEAEATIEVVAETELVEAVRRAARGDSYLNPKLGAKVASTPPVGPPDGLTGRELDVLRMIAFGHTNAEIAERLFLSVRTIETHRAHIQQKLGLSTRAELVRYAIDHGWMDVR